MKLPSHLVGLLIATLASLEGQVAQSQTGARLDQAESVDVAEVTLRPHTLFVFDSVVRHYQDQRVWAIDGDSGKVLGLIPAANWANFALSPDGTLGYVAETEWGRNGRGVRHDLITIYDTRTLDPVAELTISGRAIMSTKKPNFDTSADGRYGYVFNMDPGSSVVVTDLLQRRELGSVDVEDCGLVFPWGETGFASLCSDGGLLSVTFDSEFQIRKTRLPSFFAADTDPVFEHSAYDRSAAVLHCVSYAGLVRAVHLDKNPTLEPEWSLQEAAGLGRLDPSYQEAAWRPGGVQLAALHAASQKLYLLMHEGKPWSHKEPGTELWIFDLPTHKLLRRVRLPIPALSVSISQDPNPVLVLVGRDGGLMRLEAASGTLMWRVNRVGDNPRIITTIEKFGREAVR